MNTVRVFAYGTLITRARSSVVADILDTCLVGYQEASVRGRLYDLGPYPGLKPAARRRECAYGQILELRSPERSLSALDDYEDYDPRRPTASPYRRRWSRVALAAGGYVHAWVYWYQGPMQRAQRIPHGDWRRWANAGATD